MPENKNNMEEDLDVDVEPADYELSVEKKSPAGYYKVDFTIIQDYGQLSNRKYPPFFRFVIWNGKRRFDLRSWEGLRPRKGVTFTETELKVFYLAISDFFSTYTDRNTLVRDFKAGNTTATIHYHIATLSLYERRNITWSKEVNLVSWGVVREKRIDFRSWAAD